MNKQPFDFECYGVDKIGVKEHLINTAYFLATVLAISVLGYTVYTIISLISNIW